MWVDVLGWIVLAVAAPALLILGALVVLPTHIEDRHAVPLCEITLAFGGGAGTGGGSLEERIKPSGARGQGAGGAAKTRPVAVLIIDGDAVRLEALPD